MDILHHPAGKASIFLSKIAKRSNICLERNARLPNGGYFATLPQFRLQGNQKGTHQTRPPRHLQAFGL